MKFVLSREHELGGSEASASDNRPFVGAADLVNQPDTCAEQYNTDSLCVEMEVSSDLQQLLARTLKRASSEDVAQLLFFIGSAVWDGESLSGAHAMIEELSEENDDLRDLLHSEYTVHMELVNA